MNKQFYKLGKKAICIPLITMVIVTNIPSNIFAQASEQFIKTIDEDKEEIIEHEIITNNETEVIENLPAEADQHIDIKQYYISDEDFVIKDGVLIRYTGDAYDVVIPDNVVKIGDNAFESKSRIETVVIPEGVKEIGTRAFRHCFRLESVKFPSTLIKIGSEAFSNCFLKSLELSENIEEINEYAFEGNNYISEIKIPNKLKKIEDGVFKRISELKTIDIPDNITYIGDEAFASTGLEEVTMSNNVEFIGKRAFGNCGLLRQINLSKKLTSLSDELFMWCDELKEIEISENITYIGKGVFSNCNALESIKLPETLTVIEDDLFAYCRNLMNVNIPKSVMKIGENAFNSCKKLESIDIPSQVNEIGKSAFFSCSQLTTIILPENLTEISESLISYCTGLSEIDIPKSVTKIGSSAFSGCNFISINIPKDVNYIGNSAFLDCKKLKNINLPQNINFIASSLFSGCISLEKIEIPKLVKSIGGSAFSRCILLKDVEIPNLVSGIGTSAFENCTNLTSIKIPDNVTQLPWWVFRNCTSLKKVDLSENLKKIDLSVFENCTSLETITIPISITKIHESAFKNCTNLIYKVYENSYGETYIKKYNKKYTVIKDASNLKISNVSNQVYTGRKITPSVRVTLDNETLIKGIDYDVEYINNLKVGTGIIKIIGKNNYFGSKEITFKIIPKSVESLKVSSVNTSTVNLSWKSENSCDGYIIYRYNSSSRKYEKITTIKGYKNTSFSDKKRSSGTTYDYRVETFKKVSNITYYGRYVSIKSVTQLAKPLISLKTKSKSVIINWNKISGANGYEIYRSTSKSGKYSLVKRGESSKTLTYTNKGLKKGKVYYYKVRAYKTVSNKNTYGIYSYVAKIKCK